MIVFLINRIFYYRLYSQEVSSISCPVEEPLLSRTEVRNRSGKSAKVARDEGNERDETTGAGGGDDAAPGGGDDGAAARDEGAAAGAAKKNKHKKEKPRRRARVSADQPQASTTGRAYILVGRDERV